MNNIDKILEKIRDQAEATAAGLRAETDARIAELNEECDGVIKDMREKSAAKCEKEREIILRRAESSSAMRRREIMLGARVGLLDKAYAEAERFLLEMDRDAYSALLAKLLADALSDRMAEKCALAEYGEETEKDTFEVAFNAKERDEIGKSVIKDALEILAERGGKSPKAALAKDAAKIDGGFILRSGDVECDCSIRTLVMSSRASTEAEAAQVLFQ